MNFESNRLFVPFVLAGALLPASAQETAEMTTIELRVVDSSAGRATLDRGRVDGLREGDRVVLRPRDGLPIEGRVIELSERSARLEFDDAARVAAPGTRGEASIPRERIGAPSLPADPAGAASAPEPAPVAHPAWPTPDQDWRQGMPLLNEVPALRPSQRTAAFDGRWYLISEHLVDLGGERSFGFDRAGLDLTWRNAFGHGGELHAAGEYDWRNSVVPDADDQHEAGLRFDRLSYLIGGDRFQPERLEFGRFLQHGMPEFGVLDGLEWSGRVTGGSTYGVSLGYMPEPDFRQESFRDFQLATWYRWVADESARTSFQAGFQKTFRDFTRDRDLFVVRYDLAPQRGWDLHGSAWIDLYTPHDAQKGAGLELTQGNLSIARRFEGGSTLLLGATHVAFPEMDRWEFPTVDATQLANSHVERVMLRARQSTDHHFWLREELGAWTDQDDQGGDAEAGLEMDHVLFDGGRARIAGFVTQGSTSTLWGGRFAIGRQLENGSWELGYELEQYDLTGFSAANDQIPQHRVRLSRDFHSASGWSFSAHAEWLHYAEEDAISAGIYLSRSF
ncbi:MAG: hypothetical protein IPJ19_14740 [Planctomycetes bacterium]|nr:hypothetical protein [Planctomycetota bacterium]